MMVSRLRLVELDVEVRGTEGLVCLFIWRREMVHEDLSQTVRQNKRYKTLKKMTARDLGDYFCTWVMLE
jgi:hypothetical protein